MKKMLALILALVMLACVFAGCSKQADPSTEADPSDSATTDTEDTENTQSAEEITSGDEELEPVTLKWYYVGDEMEGSADVIEAFNKKLADVLPNTTLEIVYVGSYDPYFEQWPLLLAGGEEMDIAWEGWGTNLAQDAEDGNVLPLSELMNKYAPNLVKESEIWPADYNDCSKDGELYAIPSIQPTVLESKLLTIDPSVADYFDIDAILEETHTHSKVTEKFYDLLEKGIQNAIDAGALTLGDNSWYINTEIMPLAARGYVCLDASGLTGTLGNYFIDPESDSGEVLFLYDIPEVQMAAERMKKWADLGYFTQAQIAGQRQEGALEVLCANIQSTGSWQGADERGVKSGMGNDGNEKVCLLLDLPEQNYVGPSSFAFATAQVIPYTSKNPERAMMLLNLLHDEPGTVGNDLMNLLCYGFEANSEEAAEYGWANYTAVEEDGQMYADPSIRGGADSKHTMTNWVMGNTYKIMHDGGSLTTAANKAYAMDFWENKYSTFKTCIVSNMQLSSLDVATELESVSVIYKEYKEQLKMGGGLDLLNECVEKMNNSGLNTIKENLKAQIDAFNAQ